MTTVTHNDTIINMDWRKEHPQYTFSSLDESTVPPTPWALWNTWQEEAKQVLQYTNEIALATADTQGNVSNRMVLLKISDETHGFCWFSNNTSEKGTQIALNPHAEILWFNSKHHRQMRVRGLVHELPREQAVEYAHSRPIRSQISALISKQSETVHSKAYLQQIFDTAYQQYNSDDISHIPVSKHWTGYRLTPNRFEFWQGQPNRLHDRICYIYDTSNSWDITRLYP